MQRPPLPPDPFFAWAFFAVLVGTTLIASYIDMRKAVLPKALTLTMLALGVLFNVIRGAWLGALQQPVWWSSEGGPWLGAVEGLLFALAGFGLALATFVLMWALKTCGGGDVKLFAALGAWVGFKLVIFIMLLSVLILVVLLVVRLFTGGLRPMAVQKRLKQSQVIQGGPVQKGPAAPKWRMTYAFPVAVGTAVVLLWFYRVDLHLAAPKAGPDALQVEAHND